MGYLFQNQCYETKQEFINVYAQNCQGSGGSGGLGTYYTLCTANTDTVTIQAYTLTNGRAQTPFEITPQVISCDFASFSSLSLSTLPWSDVHLLISALILSCSLAVGFNIISKLFYRG